jgi:O-antigen ligase
MMFRVMQFAADRTRFSRGFGMYPIHAVAVAAGLFCGASVVRQQHLFSATAGGAMLLCLLLSAYLAITLSIEPELLFAFWIVVAPLFQESGLAETTMAKDLGLVFYVLPPLVLVAVMLLRGSSRPLRFVDALPALYFAYILVSAKFVSDQGQGLRSDVHRLYITVGIGIVAYYFLALGPTTPRLAARVCRALLAGASLVAAMAVVEGVTGWNLWHDTFYWRGHGISRAVATLANPAVLGTFLAMAVAMALAILLWNGPESLRRPSKWFIALSLPALFFTYTRGPMIAAAVVAVALVVLSARARWPSILALAVAGTAFILLSGQFTSSSVYQARFGDTHNIQARVILQKASFTLASQRPVFGWGFGSFNAVKNGADLQSADPTTLAYNTSHNSFLTVLVELGVVGLVLLLLPWLIISRRAISVARRHTDARWLLAGIVGAVAAYLISASTYDARFFSFVPALPWILLGLARCAVDDEGIPSESH